MDEKKKKGGGNGEIRVTFSKRSKGYKEIYIKVKKGRG